MDQNPYQTPQNLEPARPSSWGWLHFGLPRWYEWLLIPAGAVVIALAALMGLHLYALLMDARGFR